MNPHKDFKMDMQHSEFKDYDESTQDGSTEQDETVYEMDKNRDRFPYSIVWTSLPGITCCLPFIGHTGICDKKGIIHDFSGPYTVTIDDMAFGRPQKYIPLEIDEHTSRVWDRALNKADENYRKQMHNLFCNNCHSHVAHALNLMHYKGRNNWNMVDIWLMTVFNSKYVHTDSPIKIYLGFLIFAIVLFIVCAI
mmetsp:Transcript_19681/g.16826  ORF Transcript_19681/g.16826 Transcript_19681/m.16826 type:complete len:194 (+) Transcript_19681:84-665(+)